VTDLALFDPFFSELRYPQELRKMQGVGERRSWCLTSWSPG